MTKIESDIVDVINLCNTLYSDVTRDLINIANNDDQFHRRTLVRSVFAYIEGLTYVLKQIALQRCSYSSSIYSDAEKALLNDESYSITGSGEASTQVKFVRIEENVIFAIKMFLRPINPPIELTLDKNGYAIFKQAVKIRNRITHPKKYEDLTITDAEVETVRSAHQWYNELLMVNLTKTIDVLKGTKGKQ